MKMQFASGKVAHVKKLSWAEQQRFDDWLRKLEMFKSDDKWKHHEPRNKKELIGRYDRAWRYCESASTPSVYGKELFTKAYNAFYRTEEK